MDRGLWIKELYSVANALMLQEGFKIDDVVVDATKQIVSVHNFFAQGDDAAFLCAQCPDYVDDRIYMIYFLIGAGTLPEVRV